MATLRELKGRIGSVGSSEKITGAMKMISSAKMHKAESALQRLVPYRNQIQLIIRHLLCADAEYSSPLTAERDVRNVSVVVFGSDDGLCGAYNIQIFKFLMVKLNELEQKYGKSVKIRIIPVGKKVRKAVLKLNLDNVEVDKDCTLNTRSTLDEIRAFTERMKNDFISGVTDKVEVVYTHFKSVSKQIITDENLLPVLPEQLAGGAEKIEANKPYLFEPDANAIFNSTLPLFILSVMQEIAGENLASEQAARVMAMQSANDNAKSLLEELQLEYNKLRQQSITTELLDILGGQTRE